MSAAIMRIEVIYEKYNSTKSYINNETLVIHNRHIKAKPKQGLSKEFSYSLVINNILPVCLLLLSNSSETPSSFISIFCVG